MLEASGSRNWTVLGHAEMERRVMEALRADSKPEFLNRIDEMIMFHNPTPKQIGEIVDLQIDSLGKRLAESRIGLVLANGASSLLPKKTTIRFTAPDR